MGRDSKATALLLAALMAGPMAGGPAKAGPAPGALVALDGTAAGLERALAILGDSTRRCLRHQTAMLAAVAAIRTATGEAPEEGKSPVREAMADPVGLRQAQLDLWSVDDPVTEAREAAEGSGLGPSEAIKALGKHVALRRACIAWSDRSLTMLKRAMRGAPGPALEASLAGARDAAARDDAVIRSLAKGSVPLGEANIAGMETAGYRP